MLKKIGQLVKDEQGATAVEYGLIIAAIAAIIIVVVFAIGVKVNAAFETVNAEMPEAAAP